MVLFVSMIGMNKPTAFLFFFVFFVFSGCMLLEPVDSSSSSSGCMLLEPVDPVPGSDFAHPCDG